MSKREREWLLWVMLERNFNRPGLWRWRRFGEGEGWRGDEEKDEYYITLCSLLVAVSHACMHVCARTDIFTVETPVASALSEANMHYSAQTLPTSTTLATPSLVLTKIKRIAVRRLQVIHLLIHPLRRDPEVRIALQHRPECAGQPQGHALAIPWREVDHGEHDPDGFGAVRHAGVP